MGQLFFILQFTIKSLITGNTLWAIAVGIIICCVIADVIVWRSVKRRKCVQTQETMKY